MGFFNPVTRSKFSLNRRNPDGYFWRPPSRVFFQSRISPPPPTPHFCMKIPNPGVTLRRIPNPESSFSNSIEDTGFPIRTLYQKIFRFETCNSPLFDSP